ncbi:uncharacterized protein [Rhodnius prolixus]|uniref:uncharacterized protein n=1 Tax=Rhodnius prolixus TaxID=13249 RepID=UPI003D18BD58
MSQQAQTDLDKQENKNLEVLRSSSIFITIHVVRNKILASTTTINTSSIHSKLAFKVPCVGRKADTKRDRQLDKSLDRLGTTLAKPRQQPPFLARLPVTSSKLQLPYLVQRINNNKPTSLAQV